MKKSLQSSKKKRTEPDRKCAKTVKSANRKKRDTSEVPFYQSIRMRLILSFLVPVACIILLGVVSYQKASTAIINNYKSSTEQTATLMQQYISLMVDSEREELKTYLNDEVLQSYYKNLKSRDEEITIETEYVGVLRDIALGDSKVDQVYFLGDKGKSLYGANTKIVEDAYTKYAATEQGAKVIENASLWHIFGKDSEPDEAVNIPGDGYALRLVHKLNGISAAMIIDLDASMIRKAMQSLEPGTNGYVLLITSDGEEFYSEEGVSSESPMVYGTDFYRAAMDSEDIDGTCDVTIQGMDYLFVYSKLTSGDVMIAALISQERLLEETQDIKNLSVVLIVTASLIALVLGTLISNQMSGLIQYILRQLKKVSHGDLTIHLHTKRKDELGLLCKGINDTVEHVKGLIVHVNEVSDQLNSAANYVNQASGTFTETSQDIQQAISEIEVGVNKLDSGSEDCLSQMDSLSGKISNVSLNADEIGKLTSSAGSSIHNGIQSVQGLTASARSTSEITCHVIAAIEELEEKSKSISRIVAAINDIAEQTNLLSLNASIEAARAGELGRGFAVVAEEIRKLSDQCLDSASQITAIVNEIITQTGEVVEVARQAEEVVSGQSGAVSETTASFRQIDSQVASLITALNTITNSVQEMNQSRTETLEAIEGISAVSAETAACSTSVYSTAGTQLDASQELAKASRQLQEKADQLMEILTTFTV